MAKKLKAVGFILFRSIIYGPGDILPADDETMSEAWVKYGTAKWIDDTEEKAAVSKAKPVTAQPGLAGDANPKSDEDLVGCIPHDSSRARK